MEESGGGEGRSSVCSVYERRARARLSEAGPRGYRRDLYPTCMEKPLNRCGAGAGLQERGQDRREDIPPPPHSSEPGEHGQSLK